MAFIRFEGQIRLEVDKIVYIPDTVCPIGWDLFDDFCLEISNDTLTYNDALSKGCKQGIFYSSTSFGFWLGVSFILENLMKVVF